MGSIEMLKVPSLGQVGIVIEDIERTMRHYEDVLGIGPWAVFEGEPERCINLGKEVSFKGKMAMARAGTVQIELIEIIEGESIHRDFLATHGEGIHHLGFFVRDLEERVRAAQRAGISVLQRGTLRQLGLCIEYAYLDTTGTGGVIVEFIEARFMGLPFPMRSPLLRLGAGLANRLQR